MCWRTAAGLGAGMDFCLLSLRAHGMVIPSPCGKERMQSPGPALRTCKQPAAGSGPRLSLSSSLWPSAVSSGFPLKVKQTHSGPCKLSSAGSGADAVPADLFQSQPDQCFTKCCQALSEDQRSLHPVRGRMNEGKLAPIALRGEPGSAGPVRCLR